MKGGTVALLIGFKEKSEPQTPELIDCFSDEREIEVLEKVLHAGIENPMDFILSLREQELKEEEEFGNYVENLLSQPYIKSEIQNHALQWLKSKIRIEQFQKSEYEATQIIARYAFDRFKSHPEHKDYYLASPNVKVRIRVFTWNKIQFSQAA
jgi:DNA repair photolyase